MNSSTSQPSTTSARKHYNSASRSFLIRDYSSTASSLHSALSSLPPSPPHQWIESLLVSAPISLEAELKRKLDILQITFLATVHSSSPLSPTPHFDKLLQLPPDELIKALWTSLVNDDSTKEEEEEEILPTSQVSLLHPSIATSLCLAAIKLEQPKLARSVAEAWIGSASEELEKIVWEEIQEIGLDWEGELPLDGMGGAQGSTGMNGSSILKVPDNGRRQLVKSWIRLLDLLVLHILPSLDEWDAASDFVRLQSVENGGWVPDQRVEATLQRLTQIRQEEVDSAAAKVQRQKDIEAHKAAQKREARSSSKQDKGKGRARDDHSPGSEKLTTPEKKKRQHRSNGTTKTSPSSSSTSSSLTSPTSALSPSLPSPSGFAGLRSSITSYLSRSNSSSDSYQTTTRSSSNPITTIASYLRHHYSTDPLRLLSMVCFLLALSTYLRRRFSIQRGKTRYSLGVASAYKLVLGKVGETLRMGTKVTTL